LFFKCASEYAIRKFQLNQEGLEHIDFWSILMLIYWIEKQIPLKEKKKFYFSLVMRFVQKQMHRKLIASSCVVTTMQDKTTAWKQNDTLLLAKFRYTNISKQQSQKTNYIRGIHATTQFSIFRLPVFYLKKRKD
jgi:hypothetical protein